MAATVQATITDDPLSFRELERLRQISKISIQLVFRTGLTSEIFRNVRLTGSWDAEGRYSDKWSTQAMDQFMADDGCIAFQTSLDLGSDQVGWDFHWTLLGDVAQSRDINIMPTEIKDPNSQSRFRIFSLAPAQLPIQKEEYFLIYSRRLGAQKVFRGGSESIRFAAWAPDARKVELVFAQATLHDNPDGTSSLDCSGYISDVSSGSVGIDSTIAPIELVRDQTGVWFTEVNDPRLARFVDFDHRPYMYRITRDDNSVVYRTDMYSRCQIGAGEYDPLGQPFLGSYKDLDGTVSCSVVVDPSTVAADFLGADSLRPSLIPSETFWSSEFTANKPIVRSLQDLIIYELHIGSLGLGKHDGPGTFDDAMQFLDYLEQLGVNAVELLPMSEFGGKIVWGYGSSHYFALDFKAGGRDKFKYFVRACHQRGIAVIMDVCYNHFTQFADRAERYYDSPQPENDIYYWYEGRSSDYSFPRGGYLENDSTGDCPRFHEEMVRKLFVSSAVTLMEDFHIDGFRVDLTEAIHRNNRLRANQMPIANANAFGSKFLREWTTTLKLVNPNIMLIAEDHSGWQQVTESVDQGGLGFDTRWYVDFCHHLVGDTKPDSHWAKLLLTAGIGDDRALAMDYFAAALVASSDKKVVYHTSHDESGNGDGTMRPIVAAVDAAPLVGERRIYAESRLRFAIGMSLLSAGTPMLFMGEEVGAAKPFTYFGFMDNREDLFGERATTGRQLFEFCKALIALRNSKVALRSRNIEIVYTHNQNRILVFKRWDENEEYLVIASLNNNDFGNGYFLQTSLIGAHTWKEIGNSQTGQFDGDPGNPEFTSTEEGLNLRISANGFSILKKT
jgi:1,4-alpha-glucan branching enzyme